MSSLTQIIDAILNSKPMAWLAGSALLAIVIWFNYGAKIDSVLDGEMQPAPLENRGDNTSALEPASITNEKLDRTAASGTGSSSAPASPSFEERMRQIDSGAVVAKVEKLAGDVAQLDTELSAWNQRLVDLATNDSGRRIASDPAMLLAVASLKQSEPINVDDFTVLKNRVRALEEEALNVRQGKPSSSLDVAYTTTKEQFEKARTNLDRATLSLAAFEKRSQLLEPSSMTLAEAIAAHVEKEAADLSAKVAKDRQDAKQKIASEKRDAEAMQNKLALELEREQAAAEKAKMQAKIDAARLAEERAAANRQLEIEFARDWPQIQHYLGKFFAPGYTQPQSATHYEQRSTQGPVSLAAIKKTGALSDIVDGLDGAYPRFLHLMASPSNDRNVSSPYPRFIGGYVDQEHVATVRQGYTLLKKYQYLLVEKGYLTP